MVLVGESMGRRGHTEALVTVSQEREHSSKGSETKVESSECAGDRSDGGESMLEGVAPTASSPDFVLRAWSPSGVLICSHLLFR